MAAFGRRRQSQPDTAPGPVAASQAAPPLPRTPLSQSAENVILPRSAMEADDPYAPVQAVVDFINFQTNTGLYKSDELPAKAMMAYYCDYYLAQVNNGGHAQFIHNFQGAAEAVFRDVPAGLSAMGATGHAAIFADMLDAVRVDRAEDVERLDGVFYELEKHNPLTPMNAAWIRDWPELRVVDDERLTEALQGFAKMNPHRADRTVALGILSIENKLSDEVWLGCGLACMAQDGIEILLQQGNGSAVEHDGVQTIEWVLQTTSGRRTGIVGADAVHLFERIEHSPPPRLEDLMEEDRDAVWAKIEAFQPPERGEEIVRVGLETVAQVRQIAQETRAGAAIDLLLRMIGCDDTREAPLGVITPPEDTPDNAPRLMALLATREPGVTRAVIYDEGAALLTMDEQVLVRADRAEIDAHWNRRAL